MPENTQSEQPVIVESIPTSASDNSSKPASSKKPFIIIILLSVFFVLLISGAAAYYFIRLSNNDSNRNEVNVEVTPTEELIPTVTTSITIVPSSTLVSTPTGTAVPGTIKTVKLDKFNITMDIPKEWEVKPYYDEENNNGIYNYWINDESGENLYRIGPQDGGSLDHFCSEGSQTTESITIAGKVENYLKCKENGVFSDGLIFLSKFSTYFRSEFDNVEITESLKTIR